MTEEKPSFWFHAKTYGWGWGLPAKWQGWLVFAVYLGSILGIIRFEKTRQFWWPYVIIITVLFVIVVTFKGEKPVRWRWGKH